MTVMTHVKALQAGHSSQGTSEPITGGTDLEDEMPTPVVSQIHPSLLTVQGRLPGHEARTLFAALLSAAARPIGSMSTKVQCQCAGLTSCLPNIDLFSMVREQQVQTSNTISTDKHNPIRVVH